MWISSHMNHTNSSDCIHTMDFIVLHSWYRIHRMDSAHSWKAADYPAWWRTHNWYRRTHRIPIATQYLADEKKKSNWSEPFAKALLFAIKSSAYLDDNIIRRVLFMCVARARRTSALFINKTCLRIVIETVIEVLYQNRNHHRDRQRIQVKFNSPALGSLKFRALHSRSRASQYENSKMRIQIHWNHFEPFH